MESWRHTPSVRIADVQSDAFGGLLSRAQGTPADSRRNDHGSRDYLTKDRRELGPIPSRGLDEIENPVGARQIMIAETSDSSGRTDDWMGDGTRWRQ